MAKKIKSPTLVSASVENVIENIIKDLDNSIKKIFYHDDFDNKVRNIDINNGIIFYVNGIAKPLIKNSIYVKYKVIVDNLIAYLFFEELSPATVEKYVNEMLQINEKHFKQMLESNPFSVQQVWSSILQSQDSINNHALKGLKSLLNMLCEYNILDWSNDYINLISSLNLKHVDKYASLRMMDTFLDKNEQSIVVNYLNTISINVKKNPTKISKADLSSAAMLAISYSFGMRAKQIALVELGEIDLLTEIGETHPNVYINFKKIKQRTKSKRILLRRKLPSAWCPILVEIHKRRSQLHPSNTRLFDVNSSFDVSQSISSLLKTLIGRSCSTTVLRHTAAQRLVDSGASHEVLAEFMGHSDITSGLVYYTHSLSQAELLNNALGASFVYKKVRDIAYSKFITSEQLAELKGEQQIGAAPYGSLITGVGGCEVGQPLCPSNPVSSCYGCNKFLPINNPEIHKKVLEDFRSVVVLFNESSKGEQNSPAYSQLQSTINLIQSTIYEIERKSNE